VGDIFYPASRYGRIGIGAQHNVVRFDPQALWSPFYTPAVNELYLFNDHAADSYWYIIIILGIATICAGSAYCVGQPYIWGSILFAFKFISVS
jgi:hypothetical protein